MNLRSLEESPLPPIAIGWIADQPLLQPPEKCATTNAGQPADFAGPEVGLSFYCNRHINSSWRYL